MSNIKILIVEDDPNFGSILRDYLSLHSYDVVLARNGIEGLEKFNNYVFDLCILDVMMPFKDGFSLAKDIRLKDDDIPLFFLTAKSLKDDINEIKTLYGSDDKVFTIGKTFHELPIALNDIMKSSVKVTNN